MRSRSLAALGLDADPFSAPLSYPGDIPAESGLLVDDLFLALTPVPRAPIGQWMVASVPLDEALGDLGQAITGARHPVLAIGSNAAPAQLHRKFLRHGVSCTVPLTKAVVSGIGRGVSAHLSRPGYLPATPVIAPGARTQVAISWLDEAQLAALDATEPAYHRALLPGDRYPVTPAPPALHAYVSRHGCLVADGVPVPLAAQSELLAGLLARSPALRALLGSTPQDLAARAAAHPAARERARQLFADEGWVSKRETEALFSVP